MAKTGNEDFPPKLYKYRDWSNTMHRRLLTERELWMASPRQFNDPFDCRIYADFSLLDTEGKIQQYIEEVSNRNRAKMALRGIDVDALAIRADMYDRLTNDAVNTALRWKDVTFDMQDRRYGIVSLSPTWDIIPMWAHYCANHTGFCVGLNTDKLVNSGNFGKGGEVVYSDDFPAISPLDEQTPESGFVETHTKAKCWSYEREYRLFKTFPTDATNADRAAKLAPDCFAEIYLGVSFPSADVDEMIEIAIEMRVNLYQCKPVPYKFLLEHEQLV